MKALIAFTKKEFMEQRRSGKMLFLAILFVVFGIMNPAIAKLTPWLMEMFADSLAQSGMTVTEVTVTAMDSWVQFFKNIPMALIAFVLLEGSIFTKEYTTGTLVLSLTKGLPRKTVVISKAIILAVFWTVAYWLCFGITYGYNAYFWDNSIAQNLLFACVSWWLFGLWVIALMILFSCVANASSGVLLGTGGIVLVCYLLAMIPKISNYLPTKLSDGNSLIYAAAEAKDYSSALIITAAMCIIFFPVSIAAFNKKQL